MNDLTSTSPPASSPALKRRFWTLSAGRGGEHWEQFYSDHIAAIGWDALGDLKKFESKEDLRLKLVELEGEAEGNQSNDALACWQFANEMEVKDIVLAKQGLTQILGCGVVESIYSFDAERSHYRHVRDVNWLVRGNWRVPEHQQMARKTLTDVTRFGQFLQIVGEIIGLDWDNLPSTEPSADGPTVEDTKQFWWLNANPQIWSFDSLPVGHRQTYTSHNDKGNKRQKYKWFEQVAPGDLVVGYVTTPTKAVVSLCKITKPLQTTPSGEGIEFEKVEHLKNPLSFAALQAHPDLAQAEPITNNQGSLFRLAPEEFEIVRSLIDEANPPSPPTIAYTKEHALKGLFLEESAFDGMLQALSEKKNLVLQGAPGVGKTFIARRLAYALLGTKDPSRVEMIQFHQSYSYEDFIQGFRPTAQGHFVLKNGVFHEFCRRAQRDEASGLPYVFIIDEINRGNLSKIFGELLMLIEPDKRGYDYSLPLAYAENSDERFYIPDNVYLLGMMNTADRSLAMVDYALRRRFRFISLKPAFGSQAFRDHLSGLGAEPGLIRKIVSGMGELNHVIAADTKNLGPGYQIGHSFFCPLPGIMPDESWFRRVVESEVVPLVEEYWFDDEKKVEELTAKLLGSNP